MRLGRRCSVCLADAVSMLRLHKDSTAAEAHMLNIEAGKKIHDLQGLDLWQLKTTKSFLVTKSAHIHATDRIFVNSTRELIWQIRNKGCPREQEHIWITV